MKLNDITQHGGIGQVRGVAPRPSSTIQPPDSNLAPPKDRAELSRDLQQESRVLDGARLVYDALPDVRADKVALAKQRLAAGYYDQPSVQDQIVAKLATDSEARPTPPLSLEAAATIKQRLADGFYDKPDVVDRIAQGLADDVAG